MNVEDFKQLLDERKRSHPIWFELPSDRPASQAQILERSRPWGCNCRPITPGSSRSAVAATLPWARSTRWTATVISTWSRSTGRTRPSPRITCCFRKRLR